MAKKKPAKPIVEIKAFFRDQQKVFWYGSHVGYCGTKKEMPINFLAGKNCLLTDGERADVLSVVIEQLGSVKITKQTKRYFDVLQARGKAARPEDRGDPPGG